MLASNRCNLVAAPTCCPRFCNHTGPFWSRSFKMRIFRRAFFLSTAVTSCFISQLLGQNARCSRRRFHRDKSVNAILRAQVVGIRCTTAGYINTPDNVSGTGRNIFTSPQAASVICQWFPIKQSHIPLSFAGLYRWSRCYPSASVMRQLLPGVRKVLTGAAAPPARGQQSRQGEWATRQAARPTGRHTWELAKQEGNKWFMTQGTHHRVSREWFPD